MRPHRPSLLELQQHAARTVLKRGSGLLSRLTPVLLFIVLPLMLQSTICLANNNPVHKHSTPKVKPAIWANITPPQVHLVAGPPTKGTVWAMAVDPKNSMTLYVGTGGQGIWKSADAGKTWFKVDTGAGSAAIDAGAIWTLTIDPVNPEVLYTAPGYSASGVWKTTDGGVNWKNITDSSPAIHKEIGGSPFIDNVAMDPANHLHLLAASKGDWGSKFKGNAGVLESMDGGDTWIVHRPVNGFGSQNWVYFLNKSSSWILTTTYGNYYRSIDSGTTWEKVLTDAGYTDITGALYHATNGALYIGGRNALYRSIDGGKTWKQVISEMTTTVMGDGKYLYTQAAFSTSNGYGKTKYLISKETDGVKWRPYSSQATCSKSACSGPASMAYDSVHHILYSSNFYAGVWKLELGAHE